MSKLHNYAARIFITFYYRILTFKAIFIFREKIFSNTNLLATRHIQRENSSLLADARRSKAPLLKLPKKNEDLADGNEN